MPNAPRAASARRARHSGLAVALCWITVAFGSAMPAAAVDLGEHLHLRGDVTAARDVLTLGDLVQDASPAIAATPVFRAPPLGQTGTIQTRRIIEAVAALGAELDTDGRLQITVTRAARRIGTAEIEDALRRTLAKQNGLDPRWTGITFDGTAPTMMLGPDVPGEPVASDVTYEARNRRVTATVWVGPSATERRAAVRVSGTAVDLVEVAVVGRALDRGDTVRAGDVSVERRPRDSVAAESILDGGPLSGRVARRSLAAGNLVRVGDLAKPEAVSRGDTVTILYEVPGMALSLRAKANESGAIGDTIAVVSAGTKKPVQAVVIGIGRVSLNAGPTGKVVATATSLTQP